MMDLMMEERIIDDYFDLVMTHDDVVELVCDEWNISEDVLFYILMVADCDTIIDMGMVPNDIVQMSEYENWR